MGHIFLIGDAKFLVLQRPLFSLYVLLSTRQCLSFIGYAGPLTSSFDSVAMSADLRGLRWYSIERLAPVGYLLSVHLLTRDAR
jgi:hypothetical protein